MMRRRRPVWACAVCVAAALTSVAPLVACGRLTDGYFSGVTATPSSSPSPDATQSPTPSGSNTPTPGQAACDATLGWSGVPDSAAMVDNALPDAVAFVLQDAANAGTRIALYDVFGAALPAGDSTAAVVLTANLADTSPCSPCMSVTYNGVAYVPYAGTLSLEFSNGTAGTMSVTFTNAKFVPKSGSGGAWCIQNTQQAQSFTPYDCNLVGATGNCVSLPYANAQVSCAGDGTMTVVQNCTASAMTCMAGACR